MPTTTRTRRSWLQFRLSTVFILTAIVAWTMARGPWVDYLTKTTPTSRWQGKSVGFYWKLFGFGDDAADWIGSRFAKGIFVRVSAAWGGEVHELRVVFGFDRMIWPASFLAAFLAWKIGQAIVARRRAQRESVPQRFGATK
jgi:hypothetical protein